MTVETNKKRTLWFCFRGRFFPKNLVSVPPKATPFHLSSSSNDCYIRELHKRNVHIIFMLELYSVHGQSVSLWLTFKNVLNLDCARRLFSGGTRASGVKTDKCEGERENTQRADWAGITQNQSKPYAGER